MSAQYQILTTRSSAGCHYVEASWPNSGLEKFISLALLGVTYGYCQSLQQDLCLYLICLYLGFRIC